MLAAREMLLERREAAAERMAAGIDDAGIRQHQVNEADVQEVVGQLVDEVRSPGLALDARAREVLFAQPAQLLGGARREYLRVAWAAVSRLRPDAVSECRHVGQLHGAFDLRVARENLLDQRRASPRQSDDEDRVGRRRAVTGGARQELAGEERLGALDVLLDARRVVVRLRTAQRVALAVVPEGVGVASLVFERLGEREVQVVVILGAQVRTRELPAHLSQVAGIEAIGLEVGEAPPGLTQTRLELEGSAIGAD